MSEIVFKNVSKSFGETRVIENLNLTLKEGEFTVLVGASGCGKTTLLRAVLKQYPDSGFLFRRTGCFRGGPFSSTCWT